MEQKKMTQQKSILKITKNLLRKNIDKSHSEAIIKYKANVNII